MGSAGAASRSFRNLQFSHRLQCLDIVAAGKGEEALAGRSAVRDISFQDALHSARRVFGDDIAIKLAPDRRVWTEAAANENVIAFDRIGIFARLNLARQKTDLGNEVLRAGMMTAGQVDVHGRVERDAGLAPARDLLGMTLGVGSCELAA